MPVSQSKRQSSAATDNDLGAPAQDPYKTVRMGNVANPDNSGDAQDLTKTQMIGNVASGDETKPEPKPGQGA